MHFRMDRDKSMASRHNIVLKQGTLSTSRFFVMDISNVNDISERIDQDNGSRRGPSQPSRNLSQAFQNDTETTNSKRNKPEYYFTDETLLKDSKKLISDSNLFEGNIRQTTIGKKEVATDEIQTETIKIFEKSNMK